MNGERGGEMRGRQGRGENKYEDSGKGGERSEGRGVEGKKEREGEARTVGCCYHYYSANWVCIF